MAGRCTSAALALLFVAASAALSAQARDASAPPFVIPPKGPVTAITPPVPVADSAGWALASALPTGFGAAIRDNEVSWTALVGFTGEVLTCRAEAARPDIPLEMETCRQVRMAGRYTPARDGEGRVVMAWAMGRTRWEGLNIRPPDLVAPTTAVDINPLAPDATVPPAPRSLPAMAELKSRSWITMNDYPPFAIRNGEQGSVTVLHHIDTDGRLRACGILASTASPALDRQTCRIAMIRARYEPALDEKGIAIASVRTTRVNWVLPDMPRGKIRIVPQGGEEVTLNLSTDKNGAILMCAVAARSGDLMNRRATICDAFEAEVWPALRKSRPAKSLRGFTHVLRVEVIKD